MGQTVRFQETLRRPTMIGEGFGEDRAGLGLGLAAASALDPKTAALLRVGAYEQHLRLHQQLGVTTGRGRWPVLADRR